MTGESNTLNGDSGENAAVPEQVPAACGNCIFAFWTGEAQTPQGKIPTGYCRRNPPVPLLKMIPSQLATAPPKYEIMPTYAPTNAVQWCGEHMTFPEYMAMKAELLEGGEHETDTETGAGTDQT